MAEEKPAGMLDSIETPADLRALARGELRSLSDELRRYLIETVGQMGGHLAAGLGTVELAVALHYVFDTPYDRVIWDVGHQAYPHKVLTGRGGGSAASSSAAALRRSRRARRASTTASASATRAPRSAPRSAWRSPTA
jgi:deoxyxylulose-5-phosphate synthase